MGITQKQKDANYRKAQHNRGLVKVNVWIPKANKQEFEDRAEQLRYEHLKGLKDGHS